jgi:hypothetical protein
MEDENNNPQETSAISPESSRRTRVGFPQMKEKKGGGGKFIFIILAILALVTVGVWLIFGRAWGEDTEIVVAPTVSEEIPSPTEVPVEIERDEIKIQILNGSGISGAAGDLREEMEDLGYSDIVVGNASNQDYETTEVTFYEELPQGVRDEIIAKLEDVYQSVDTGTGSTGDYDIVIITGLPKGFTPSPTDVPPTPTPVADDSETEELTPTPAS